MMSWAGNPAAFRLTILRHFWTGNVFSFSFESWESASNGNIYLRHRKGLSAMVGKDGELRPFLTKGDFGYNAFP